MSYNIMNIRANTALLPHFIMRDIWCEIYYVIVPYGIIINHIFLHSVSALFSIKCCEILL